MYVGTKSVENGWKLGLKWVFKVLPYIRENMANESIISMAILGNLLAIFCTFC